MGRLIAAEAWTSLEAGLEGKGLTRQRVAARSPIDVFIAVEHPGSAWLVLFGLPSAELAASIDIPQATGIQVRAVPALSDMGWGYAEIRLLDGRYAELFAALADDLVENVERSHDIATAVDRLADRLRRWESFLKVVAPDGLTSERRAGLYGELHVLRAHLMPVDSRMAVAAWVGPNGAHQDFQSSDWALEVKTSRTKEPVSVRISGERQLDDLGLTWLGLAQVGLEQRRSSGETLPEMVSSIRVALAETPAAEPFEALLFAAGYLGAHEPKYLDDGYLIRFDHLFRVTEGFPRITERDLMPGVGGISYTISAAAMEPFRSEWSHLPTLIGGASENAADDPAAS